MKNKWKNLFFLLMAINLAIIAVLFVFISLPVKEDNKKLSRPSSEKNVPFLIKTNKHDLNLVINHYLDKEAAKGPIDYQVLLEDEVELYGTMSIFTRDIDMKVTFQPEALENGDLVLKQKSIQLGRLKLPESYVLKLVKDRYNFPDWVIIQPNDQTVYIALNKMKLKSDVKVKAEEFNLKNDQISFSLLVPAK